MTKVPRSWRKSSFSAQQTDCVELAGTLDALRDSKNPDAILTVTRDALTSLLSVLSR